MWLLFVENSESRKKLFFFFFFFFFSRRDSNQTLISVQFSDYWNVFLCLLLLYCSCIMNVFIWFWQNIKHFHTSQFFSWGNNTTIYNITIRYFCLYCIFHLKGCVKWRWKISAKEKSTYLKNTKIFLLHFSPAKRTLKIIETSVSLQHGLCNQCVNSLWVHSKRHHSCWTAMWSNNNFSSRAQPNGIFGADDDDENWE